MIFLSFVNTPPNTSYFPDYKEILHFRYPSDYNELMVNYFAKHEQVNKYPSIIYDPLPDSLDPKHAETLYHLGYIRNEVKRKDITSVDSLFSIRKNEAQKMYSEYLPIYRDIPIFRNKKEVKGIVLLKSKLSDWYKSDKTKKSDPSKEESDFLKISCNSN